jgi:tetratricopeptide (TPR) repeat protein
MAATQPPTAARAADAAIADMLRVTRFTMPPTAASHALLAEAYRLRMDLATDPDTAYDAYAAMQRSARQALAIMDRQPDALRLLIISALEQEDAVEARALLTTALRVEPYCVDYRLYAAQAAALDGDYQQAVDAAESATRFAPLLPEAWQVLAHQRFLLAQHDPASSVTLADVCAGYARALALRDALPAAYRLEYATALLLTGDLDGVLREARHLRGTPEHARLLASIPSFYRMLGQPTAAARLLARLRE